MVVGGSARSNGRIWGKLKNCISAPYIDQVGFANNALHKGRSAGGKAIAKYVDGDGRATGFDSDLVRYYVAPATTTVMHPGFAPAYNTGLTRLRTLGGWRGLAAVRWMRGRNALFSVVCSTMLLTSATFGSVREISNGGRSDLKWAAEDFPFLTHFNRNVEDAVVGIEGKSCLMQGIAAPDLISHASGKGRINK